jgi:hypothetical protein
MSQKKENYTLLIEKLDRFIRKYYTNKLIRGSLYFVGSVLAIFLLFSFLESQYYFSTSVRKILFYGFILLSMSGLIFWVARPASKYFRLGKTISHEQAAQIIGDHFQDIQDKLLNILHLRKQMESAEAKELIFAGIEQKSEKINPVPFRKAIDFRKNRKYLRYALMPLLLLLVILFAAPSMITESTNRIIKNDIHFEKEAPFSFQVLNDQMEVVQYSDFQLDVNILGDIIPNEVYVRINQYQYRMKKDSLARFTYVFKNLYKDTEFIISSGEVDSKEYNIKVLPKPSLDELIIDLEYPAYIKRKNEKIRDNGDLIVPAGTISKWKLSAKHTQNLAFSFGAGSKELALKEGEETFSYKKRLVQDGSYKLYIENRNNLLSDSVGYFINIIPDKYPVIDVEEFRDSTQSLNLFFAGSASDDYGLTKLQFKYAVIGKDGVERKNAAKQISFDNSNRKSIQYDYAISMDSIGLMPGERLHYYFEIFDNDAVNGSKSSRTGLMQYYLPSLDEFEKQEDANEEEIKDKLKETLDEIKKLKKEFEKNREKLLQKKEPEWQDKKELEKLLEQQKELEKMIEEAKQKFEENLKNQENYREQSEEILEKQEQLQKMFDEVLSQEQKDLMQKIEELMQELQKDEMLEMMEDLQMDNETMEKEMDRLLELFKQLELEKEVMEQIDKLNELAEEQEKLSEETKEENKGSEELKKEQSEINKEFEKLNESMKDIMEKNKELERPKNLAKDNEEKMEDISDDLQDTQESLEKQKNQDASKSQKSAAQKMKAMAASLQMQMEAGQMEQSMEDLRALRQLLENLLTLSFEQEQLIDDISEVDPLTPRYNELVTVQFDLKEDFRMIEDSLQALSKRVAEIESFVIEKVADVKTDMAKALKNLEGLETMNALPGGREKDVAKANQFQRSTMKNINDLALMLDESMQQMQQNMSGVPGAGSCNKPGGNGSSGKSGPVPKDKISQGQKGLNDQMKGMMEGKQKGNAPTSKEFAQAAARQAAMRKALEQMRKELQEEGKGAGNQLQELIDEMNKTEIDLINKRLDNEMMRRQQDIFTKLLEAENADRQRKLDDERKSKTADQLEKKFPPALEEYLKKRQSELDLYKTVSPSLNPFYKKLVDEYYMELKKSR